MLKVDIAVITAMAVDGFLFSPARAVAGASRRMCVQISWGREAIYPSDQVLIIFVIHQHVVETLQSSEVEWVIAFGHVAV